MREDAKSNRRLQVSHNVTIVAEAEKFKSDESLKVKSNSCDPGEDGYVFVPKFG